MVNSTMLSQAIGMLAATGLVALLIPGYRGAGVWCLVIAIITVGVFNTRGGGSG